MQAKRQIVAGLVFAAALVLVSCDFSAGSEGSAPPGTTEPVQGQVEGDAPDDAGLALTVGEEPFTLSELTALPTIEVSAAGETYEGVAIVDLLSAAQVTDVLSITLVARDAISVELDVPSLTPDSILAFAPGGLLDAVLPRLEPERWPKDVVVIDAQREAQVALRVDDQAFAVQDLQAMKLIEVKTEDEVYEGIPIRDLLDAAGADGPATFILVDREGESVEVPVMKLMAGSILALDREDTLQAVLPGLADTYWLTDVVEIRTTP